MENSERYIFRVIRSKLEGIWHWKIERNKPDTIDGVEYIARIIVKHGQNADGQTAVAEMKTAYEAL